MLIHKSENRKQQQQPRAFTLEKKNVHSGAKFVWQWPRKHGDRFINTESLLLLLPIYSLPHVRTPIDGLRVVFGILCPSSLVCFSLLIGSSNWLIEDRRLNLVCYGTQTVILKSFNRPSNTTTEYESVLVWIRITGGSFIQKFSHQWGVLCEIL